MTDNPRAYLPFGEMSPDLGHISASEEGVPRHLLLAENVFPLGNHGYAPAGDLSEAGFSQTPAGQPTGSALFDQQWLYYGNTEGEIWEANYSALTIVQRHTAVSSGVDWSLVRYGDSMVATNGADPLLVQTARAASFADLITAGFGIPTDAQDETDYDPNLINAQTEADYDNSPTTEGTFTAGTGYGAAETITLSDGSVLTITSVGGGTVTGFTVNSASSTGVVSGVTLTQSSTSGSGTGFDLTPEVDNITSDGTFAGGTGHAAADVITLGDGTAITVDVEVAGVVTEFTVDSSGSDGGKAVVVKIGGTLSQTSTTGSGVDFSITLAAANFTCGLRAKYVESFRERVVLANITTTTPTVLGPAGAYPYTVVWSGAQAANDFDVLNLATRPSFQPQPTKWGVITGLAEAGDVLLVAFERGWYRMGSVDGLLPYAFGFEPVVEGVGTVHPRSIVSFAGAAYFWGPMGPSVVSPSGYSELGSDKITTSLLSGRWPLSTAIELDRTQDVPDIIGCLAPSANSIIWRIPPADSSYNDELVVWNFHSGRWSIILFRKNTGANILTDAQDETDYDGAGSNGTFLGGVNHVVADIVTVADQSLVTVDAVSNGRVTQFTVDSTNSTGATAGSPLTQTGTTGSGTGFSLTPGTNNLTSSPVINNTIRFLEDRSDVYGETWEIGSTIALGSFDGTNVTIKKFSTDVQGGENGLGAFVGPARFQMAFSEILAGLDVTPTHMEIMASPASGTSGLPAVSVTINSKKNPLAGVDDQDTVTVTTEDSPFLDSGFMSLQSAGKHPPESRFHQPDVTITPTNTWRAVEYQGVALMYSEGGPW